MRLPNGEYTQDQDKYFKEWGALSDALEKIGYTVLGFDPGFSVNPSDGMGRVCNISAAFAIKVKEQQDRIQELEEALRRLVEYKSEDNGGKGLLDADELWERAEACFNKNEV